MLHLQHRTLGLALTGEPDPQRKNITRKKAKMKNRMVLVSAFLFLVASAATAQSLLPQPQIIDHQIVSGTDVQILTATENVQSAYNILEAVVTCDHNDTGYCMTLVEDSNGHSFTPVSSWHNDTNDWTEEIWYLIEPSAGTTTVKGGTEQVCGGCSVNMLVQQIQGIGAAN